MHIGIAGIGKMGLNIGARLMEMGQTLTVWNRTADKTKPLTDAGAKLAKSPAELARLGPMRCSTIITNADAIEAMYHGADGLLSGDVKGQLFIEMSTVPPECRSRSPRRSAPRGAA